MERSQIRKPPTSIINENYQEPQPTGILNENYKPYSIEELNHRPQNSTQETRSNPPTQETENVHHTTLKTLKKQDKHALQDSSK